MQCQSLLKASKSKIPMTPNGKSLVIVGTNFLDDPDFESIHLPCGKCIACRLNKVYEWAIRCVHEASCWENNCFITLTYSDDNLPENGQLVLAHIQGFIKRLRFKYQGVQPVPFGEDQFKHQIRYYYCGEYGEKLQRPHYHVLVFNFDFPDRRKWGKKRQGYQLYRSKVLESLWPYGYSSVGELTETAAAYVTGYVTKKITGKEAKERHYKKVNEETGEIVMMTPEFSHMSLKPGIAEPYFKNGGSQIYAEDSVTLRGYRKRPPRYYDKMYDLENPDDMETVRERRRRQAQASDGVNKRRKNLEAARNAGRANKRVRTQRKEGGV